MSIFQPVHLIGGQGGVQFRATGGTDGKVLEKIGVWAGGWQIKALRIWLTDSDACTFGNLSGPYKEFTFNPGERITALSLWGNGAGTRTGWIHFATNQGRSFDHGMTDGGRKQEYPIDIGSGICVGVTGRAGADIDCMGFVFLQPIRYSVLRDVRYPKPGLEHCPPHNGVGRVGLPMLQAGSGELPRSNRARGMAVASSRQKSLSAGRCRRWRSLASAAVTCTTAARSDPGRG